MFFDNILKIAQSKYAEFNGDVHFHSFQPKILFLGKFGLKSQDCLFKVKFGTQTNLNMQNSMVTITLSVFDWNYSFRANFGFKNSKLSNNMSILFQNLS